MTLRNNPYGKDLRDVLITVVLFVLAYAPSPFGFLVYLAFVPQLKLYTRHNWPKAIAYGYLTGLLINVITLYWIYMYAGYGFAIIVSGNALQFAVFGGLVSYIHARNKNLALFSFPFLWTCLEYSRQLGDLAFNWLNIAYTQSYYLYLLQYVDYTGYLGIVLWICLVNLTIYYLIEKRYNRKSMMGGSVALLLLFALPLISGFVQLSQTNTARGISAAYVQPNVEPEIKWQKSYLDKNLPLLFQLTDSIGVSGPDLVIWPETAIPYNLRAEGEHLARISDHVLKKGYHLLVGALDEVDGDRFNAAYFFSPQESTYSVYHKIRLVPGAEALPYMSDWFTSTRTRFLSAGVEPTVFTYTGNLYQIHFNGEDWQIDHSLSSTDRIGISAVICYESAFPNLVRRFHRAGSDLEIIITNDGWFGYSSQPYQHARVAVFRAIENRSSVIRCANTGISEFIDPYGRVYAEGQLGERRMAQKVMPLRLEETFYTRYGDWLGIISGIFVISSLILALLTHREKPAG